MVDLYSLILDMTQTDTRHLGMVIFNDQRTQHESNMKLTSYG
jgi:hypothetical protein